MTPEQQRKYFHDIDTQVRDTDVLRTQLLEARIEGRNEGRAEAEEEARLERLESARNLKENGVPIDIIVNSLGLSADEIATL
jgi:predicted transposase YdaD